MKKIEVFKKVILNGCFINTVIVLLICVLANIYLRVGLAPNLRTIIMVFIFSMLTSAAGLILSVKKLSLAVKIIIHYLSVAALFYLIFFVWGGFADKSSLSFFAMVLFTVIYSMIMAIYLAVCKISRKKSENTEYESQF